MSNAWNEYAAVILTTEALANHAGVQERKWVNEFYKSMGGTGLGFTLGAGTAALAVILFNQGSWLAWVMVVFSIYLLFSLVGNIQMYYKSKARVVEWEETRKIADGQLRAYILTIPVTHDESS